MDIDTRNKIIGFVGGILIIISLIPQFVKILVNKSSKNISLVTYFILLVAQCIWTAYGVLNNDLQVTVTNIASSVLTTFIIIAAQYYRVYNKETIILDV